MYDLVTRCIHRIPVCVYVSIYWLVGELHAIYHLFLPEAENSIEWLAPDQQTQPDI